MFGCTSAAHDAGDQRLRQEARAAAALVHPNIATIYALDDIDGRAYIASELLDGETLREVLGRGPLPREEALVIAHALASALEAAHARGIVHRDLKPENVLRLSDGRVKILDFGLARLEGDARRLASTSRLTLQGLIAGTPGYMAPEQLLGEEVDGRTDQFALGVVLAEMASGRNPFDAGTFAATIALVMRADGLPVPLDGARVSADIAAIVNRCTRHRREDRFATTGDLVAALAACLGGSGVAALPLDPHTGRRPAIWWWRFHQAAAAAVYWLMTVPAWLVHRDVPPGLPWFLACLAATIVAANVRLHLRFSAAVLPHELPAQRARTRGFVAIADWAILLLWAWAGVALMETSREWAVVFFAFAVGVALVVALIEPATTRAAFAEAPARRTP
jgi:Protein kinase domain